MNQTIITTSWDDGHPLDRRLASLLESYDIPGTFYIPLENPGRETLAEADIAALSERFDIGGHTYNHRFLEEVPLEVARKEILKGKQELERLTQDSLSCFCYPGGQFDSDIKRLVRDAGFECARTIHPLRVGFDQDPYELGTTVKLIENRRGQLFRYITDPSTKRRDWKLWIDMFKRGGLLNGKGWELAMDAIDHVVDNGGIFHLWEHSWKIDYTDSWHELETVFQLIDNVSSMDDVVLMNNSELVAFLAQRENHE